MKTNFFLYGLFVVGLCIGVVYLFGLAKINMTLPIIFGTAVVIALIAIGLFTNPK